MVMKKRNPREAQKIAESILDFYFREDSDAELDQKIQQWLADDSSRQEKDTALKQVWDDRVKSTDQPDWYAYASLKSMRSRLGFPEHPAGGFRSLHRKVLRIAAAVILFGGLSGALFFLRDKPLFDDRSAPTVAVQIKTTVILAENLPCRHIVLPDGSEVWVRRGGTISFPEDFGTGRTVHLEGEAYFSVVKQDGKPFKVSGSDITVNVLGTEFNMKTGEGMFPEVMLVEGSVEATIAEQKLTMKPGEGLLYDSRTGEMTLQQVELSEVAPWKEIDLVFADTPMKEVFHRISNYFNTTLMIDEGLSLYQTFTATIGQDESLEEVLFIVRNTIKDFDYSIRENNTVTITRHQ